MEILPLMHDDDHYYVQMAQGWLIAELAVHEPETVYAWMQKNDLKYNINGKAIQKICDSFRIADGWKTEFKKLRPMLREGNNMELYEYFKSLLEQDTSGVVICDTAHKILFCVTMVSSVSPNWVRETLSNSNSSWVS